jgi:hypothetical protein
MMMHLINNKNINSPKTIKTLSNLNDYIIQIDYFDKNGNKKIKNNIPLEYIFNKKQTSI